MYKHPPTVSSRFFSQSRTRSTLEQGGAPHIRRVILCQSDFFLGHVQDAEQEQYKLGPASPISAAAASFVLTIQSIACGDFLASTRNRQARDCEAPQGERFSGDFVRAEGRQY